MTKSRIKALANLAVEVLLIVNMVLSYAGKTPLPLDEQGVMQVVYGLLTGLQTLRVWWFNQNMTVEAETGQALTDELKATSCEAGGEFDPLDDPEDPEGDEE